MTQKKQGGRPKSRLPKINMRLETIKRIVIFSLATLILGTAQCSFFSNLNLCPRTPDLIMGLILAVILCDGERSGMALAIGAGFFIDAIGATGIFISPLVYFIYALLIGAISKKLLKGFPSYLLLLLPSLLYRAVITLVMSLITKSAQLGGGLFLTLLLEAVTTLVLCLPIYFIIKLATIPLRTHKKFSL